MLIQTAPDKLGPNVIFYYDVIFYHGRFGISKMRCSLYLRHHNCWACPRWRLLFQSIFIFRILFISWTPKAARLASEKEKQQVDCDDSIWDIDSLKVIGMSYSLFRPCLIFKLMSCLLIVEGSFFLVGEHLSVRKPAIVYSAWEAAQCVMTFSCSSHLWHFLENQE